MPLSPDDKEVQHAGLVVDPLAEDDGPLADKGESSASTPDSEVSAPEGPAASRDQETLESQVPTPAVADSGESGSPDADFVPRTVERTAELTRGEALRERLLERARSASALGNDAPQSNSDGLSALDEIGRDAARLPAGVDPTPSASSFLGRSKTQLRPKRPQLSPTMIAVFGSLLGVATVASLVLLGMRLGDRQAELALGSAPAGSAKALPSAEPAKPPPPKGAVQRERRKVPGPWRVEHDRKRAGVRIISGKVGVEPFLRAVQDAGLEKKQAYRVLKALEPIRDLNKCDRSDRFAALVDTSTSEVLAFEYIVSPEEVYQARANADGLLVGTKLDLHVRRERVAGALRVEDVGFSASAERAGFEPGLDKVLDAALEGHTSLSQLETGDRLRIIAQEVTVLGEFARYAGVEAVEILPASSKKEAARFYYFNAGSERGHFDRSGRAPYEGGWKKPVKDAPVTSRFNPKRMHPVLKKVMPHNGTDFGAPTGTPVRSSSYGTVSYVGYAGPSGNLVKLEHPGGVETGYAHLSRFADGLKVGQKVERLELIGYVGSTGRSTGPHLHFSASRNGQFFDPETLNLDGLRVLPKQAREEFAQAMAKYDKQLDAIPVPEPLPERVEVASAALPVETEVSNHDDMSLESPSPSGSQAQLGPPPRATRDEPPSPPTLQTARPHAIYLTDKELMELQGAVSDGEVAR